MLRKKSPLLIVCGLIIISLIAVIVAAILHLQNNFSLTLQLGETKYFSDKKTKITLQQVVLPQSNQKDGITQVQILIDKNNQKEELTYKIGGFAGFDVRELNFSSGTVKLIDIKNNQVKLDITFK